MALGGVRAGYAETAYAYRKTTTATEEFYSEVSSAAQLTEETSLVQYQNDRNVIGLAMIPYGDTNVSYGMKAQYAAESTPDNPVIQVTSNYGGQWVSYNVNVNEVDPRNASQLEMFALLSYSDERGISDGGTFGSYHQMKVYADNAQANGYWEGNGSWDDFVNAKQDWLSLMMQMADDYSRAGIYSQSLNCQKLEGTLSHFNIQHMDFGSIKWEDRSDRTFSHYELNIPRDVLKAWLEVAADNEMDNEMFSHMSSKMVQRFKKHQEGDAAGSPIEAALKAAREAMQDLEYPLTAELGHMQEIQEELEQERAFYQAFADKLENMLKEQGKAAEASDKPDGAEGTDGAGNNGADENPIVDFMQFIRERMEEIFIMIQNGDTEPAFQIGSNSFTIKEWDEFLEKFDAIEDAIKELMREEWEKQAAKEEAAETAGTTGAAGATSAAETAGTTGAVGMASTAGTSGAEEKETVAAGISKKEDSPEPPEGIGTLVSESTKCTYPASSPQEEDTLYITWYTEEGIFCRKAGQSEGYEWSVYFENKTDYNKVMEFLGSFNREDNLRFAAHENFWRDFLKDEIDIEGFREFFEGTDHGVPDYSITVGDSMYIDKDKLQWAKYMNPLGTRLFTGEEMMRMQEELMEANRAKLTKLSNPYTESYSQPYEKSYKESYLKSHQKYKGESIFCEYPGGPLYTADEMAEKMIQNLLDWRYLAGRI